MSPMSMVWALSAALFGASLAQGLPLWAALNVGTWLISGWSLHLEVERRAERMRVQLEVEQVRAAIFALLREK